MRPRKQPTITVVAFRATKPGHPWHTLYPSKMLTLGLKGTNLYKAISVAHFSIHCDCSIKYYKAGHIFTVSQCEISEPCGTVKRNFVISWTHEMLVAAESLALRLFVAVSTTVNCRRLQDQMAKVSSTRMGSRAIFSSLNESKNSMMSAAVPMYTSSSWDSWSLVRSPAKQNHVVHSSDMIFMFLGKTFRWNVHAAGKCFTFRQHPAADDEYQHQELFDDGDPRFRVDLQVVWQQMTL